VEKLTKELAAAKEQNAELLDKYKRSLADSENMRNRLNKQISDAKIFGIQSFCKDLLEVADTLGHATQAVPKDKVQFVHLWGYFRNDFLVLRRSTCAWLRSTQRFQYEFLFRLYSFFSGTCAD